MTPCTNCGRAACPMPIYDTAVARLDCERAKSAALTAQLETAGIACESWHKVVVEFDRGTDEENASLTAALAAERANGAMLREALRPFAVFGAEIAPSILPIQCIAIAPVLKSNPIAPQVTADQFRRASIVCAIPASESLARAGVRRWQGARELGSTPARSIVLVDWRGVPVGNLAFAQGALRSPARAGIPSRRWPVRLLR